MYFSHLAAVLEKLEATTSRNEITRILGDLFREAGEGEIDKLCYLLLGELLPAYRGIEFNIAEKMMVQILATAYGRTTGEIARRYTSRGDHGDVAFRLASERGGRYREVSVGAVYDRLFATAGHAGSGSQERRISQMAELITELDPRSAKFVARIPIGKLRLGFSDATILDALSLMVAHDKSARKRIEAAYNVTADIGAIAQHLKSGGLSALARMSATPGIPIRPSLAERLKTVEEIVKKAGPQVAVEPKFDGFRTQIHVWPERTGKQVALFSRNLENTTAMFPEIVAAAKRLRVRSVILDGEAIGYNAKTGKFSPFQETAQRKRKYDIAAFVKKIPLSVFVFDILYWNGSSLLAKPQRERREILEGILGRRGARDTIRMDEQRVTNDPAVIAHELRAKISKGLEGLVVKNLAAPYDAGKRGFHWIKLKGTSALLEKLRGGAKRGESQVLDTIDCVVMGAYRGRGKRTAFGFGGFLLGVRGPGDQYYSISRLGTGLSDEQFRKMRQHVAKLKVDGQPKDYVVDREAAPDTWVRPSLVVEILADGISLSSRHTAGRKSGARLPDVTRGRGYSLRFPRLVRFRDDKSVEDATSVTEVAKLYKLQKT